MIQRKRILQQSGIFLKQNPGEAHLTIDELREMANSGNANLFISKVSRYVGNIAGTNAYWNKVRDELKAIIANVGAPTLFFTFSSADMHWPELHAYSTKVLIVKMLILVVRLGDKMLLTILI
jgi:fructoselysine-6-P-deglycase FrlB-like protein